MNFSANPIQQLSSTEQTEDHKHFFRANISAPVKSSDIAFYSTFSPVLVLRAVNRNSWVHEVMDDCLIKKSFSFFPSNLSDKNIIYLIL